MKSICPTRGCGAMHDIAPEQYGDEITCRDCGARLVAEAKGLRIVTPGTAPQPKSSRSLGGDSGGNAANEATSARRRAAPDNPGASDSIILWLAGALLSLLFGAGAVLTIVCALLPMVDSARIASLQATLAAGDRRIERLDGETESKEAALKKWEPEKKKLQAQLDGASTWAATMAYPYAWGLLAGFVLLAAGAVGYLNPRQTVTRRVVGGVIICGLVLLLFVRQLGLPAFRLPTFR